MFLSFRFQNSNHVCVAREFCFQGGIPRSPGQAQKEIAARQVNTLFWVSWEGKMECRRGAAGVRIQRASGNKIQTAGGQAMLPRTARCAHKAADCLRQMTAPKKRTMLERSRGRSVNWLHIVVGNPGGNCWPHFQRGARSEMTCGPHFVA